MDINATLVGFDPLPYVSRHAGSGSLPQNKEDILI